MSNPDTITAYYRLNFCHTVTYLSKASKHIIVIVVSNFCRGPPQTKDNL